MLVQMTAPEMSIISHEFQWGALVSQWKQLAKMPSLSSCIFVDGFHQHILILGFGSNVRYYGICIVYYLSSAVTSSFALDSSINVSFTLMLSSLLIFYLFLIPKRLSFWIVLKGSLHFCLFIGFDSLFCVMFFLHVIMYVLCFLRYIKKLEVDNEWMASFPLD